MNAYNLHTCAIKRLHVTGNVYERVTYESILSFGSIYDKTCTYDQTSEFFMIQPNKSNTLRTAYSIRIYDEIRISIL